MRMLSFAPFVVAVCGCGGAAADPSPPSSPASSGTSDPTPSTADSAHGADSAFDTGTAPVVPACSADPWPRSDHDVQLTVALFESLPLRDGSFTPERGSFWLRPQATRYGGRTITVVDPYDGGEDCEVTTWEPIDVDQVGSLRDIGPATWTVDGRTATADYALQPYGFAYDVVGWMSPDGASDPTPTFGEPDVSGLYGQSVSLSWVGGADGGAGTLPDAVLVPSAIGLTDPPWGAVVDLSDLEIRWSESGSGEWLRLRTMVPVGATVTELDCRIDDDGHWAFPPDVAALLPADASSWWFDLERAHRCVHDEPWGTVHAEAVVVSAVRIDSP